ncbi:hypothetical protein [Pedobacter sp. NJ-S-72]
MSANTIGTYAFNDIDSSHPNKNDLVLNAPANYDGQSLVNF